MRPQRSPLMGYTAVAWVLLSVVCTAGLAACEGPVGPKGDPGETPDLGPLPDLGEPPDGGELLDANEPTDANEPIDARMPGVIELEPAGLVGRVLDTAGNVPTGAHVVLVPASEVAALAATPIDPTLAPSAAAASVVDEPIEDLLDAAGASLVSVAVDDTGVYRFVTLPDFNVFVVVVPAAGDLGHLPGGELARIAQAHASLVGQRVDLTVSTNQSADATYVGSAACTGCHGRHVAFGTAHFVGLNVPGRRGYLEDTSRWPNFDAALARFDAGVTLHFYDCVAGAEAPCRVSETAPPSGSIISFDAELARVVSVPLGSSGAYTVTLRNQRGAGVVTYPVELTYGGALARQVFVVPITRSGGVERQVLPFQFQHDGNASLANARAWPWADVGSAHWYDFAAGTLLVPGSLASFDRACAGCHFTGFKLAGDTTSGFRASALATPAGNADYDLDGRLEEMNVGCEGCHGPGSEHVDARGRGVAIVSPNLLLAERQDVICGSCHSRGGDGPPLDADLHQPRPGIRRAELIERFYTRAEFVAGDAWASGDPKRSQLEYTAHAASSMARNGRILVACSDCHDVHGAPTVPHDLLAPTTAPNTLCTGCHSAPQYQGPDILHIKTFTPAHEARDFASCATCHMSPTGLGGAAHRGLLDDSPVVQYWQGDVATHRYLPSGFTDVAAGQTAATVTQDCALCHRSRI